MDSTPSPELVDAADPLFPMVSFLYDSACTSEVARAMFDGDTEAVAGPRRAAATAVRRRVHPSKLPDAAANEAAAQFTRAVAAEEAAGGEKKQPRSRKRRGDKDADVPPDVTKAASTLVLARAAQFKLIEQDRDRELRETRRRTRRSEAAASVDVAAMKQLEEAVARAWRLVAITEDMNRVSDPVQALLPHEREWATWTPAEAALMQHPFVSELLKQTAHRAADDAEGVAAASCAAFVGQSPAEAGVPRGIRCAMTLLRASVQPNALTLGSLHALAQVQPWISCAADRDPVARAMLWRVAICALPLMNLSPVALPRALGSAMCALGAAAYTVTSPAQGVRICYLRIFSGCHNVVWTLRFGRAACDEKLKRLRLASGE